MAVSALDSRIFRNLFGTQEIRDLFTDEAYVKRMVDVEAALARAQSKCSLIPDEAGNAITKALNTIDIDYDKLAHDTDIVGYPVLPLIEQLVPGTPSDMAKYIHWGATTQDIMDNASVLQMRAGLEVIQRQLQELIVTLTQLSKTHRDTPMAGRTHLQHALPCTFGYKCAVYLSSILRHEERLRDIQKRCLFVQFGGAAGTLASLGSDETGIRVRAALAQELGLADPPITWHVVRDNVAEILNFLALKRNPISSEVILAASKLLRANAGLGLDAMVVDFERASGPWHLEWVAIPEAFVLAGGALHQTNFALGGLVVNTDAMMTNLCSTRGLIVGEAVMMGLAPFVGRQPAHDIVYEACRESIESRRALLDVLRERPQVTDKVPEDKLAGLNTSAVI
ncbi:putative 3-carboxy- -muconate cycloisomerase protein [Eutypa lata UCREL1]|uniref:Putative 3-carboxy--muconate cycloisomerase protein n=1 Tax=Eutypa lata (strain UCR-EL1) TaxID=1287681 RepID=M7T5L0_EUTLA|nr:putative 3-carboxy- -muconate cycloisomerase protein [Eutypa lata UCREL1]